MPRKIDWLDFAHQLHRERVAIQDTLPAGVEIDLTLSSYSFFEGARFTVHLVHRDSKLGGYGNGPTPAKALDAAGADMEKNLRERNRRPQVVVGTPAALPAPANDTLF
jgi:hypothetical protein